LGIFFCCFSLQDSTNSKLESPKVLNLNVHCSTSDSGSPSLPFLLRQVGHILHLRQLALSSYDKKHERGSSLACPASDSHQTRMRVRLRCDAVSVASTVTGHGWTVRHGRLDTAHQVDTRVTTQQALGIFIIYLKMLTKRIAFLCLLLVVPASASIVAQCRVRFLPHVGRPLLPISSLVFLAASGFSRCLWRVDDDVPWVPHLWFVRV